MSRRMSGSRALNGSSKSITFGSTTSARAEPDALLHAARQLVRELVRDVLEADEPEHLARRAPVAPTWPCPAPRGRMRRCRSRGGVRAGRSAGRPSRPCGAGGRAGRPCRPRSRRAPSISIDPAVGSISRISVRTSVDLPEPERPMTTNTSPGQTSSETSRTAAMQPVFSRSSLRERSASGLPTMRSARGPEDLPDALGADQRRAAPVDPRGARLRGRERAHPVRRFLEQANRPPFVVDVDCERGR